MNERQVERERAARLAAALDELLADPSSMPGRLEADEEALARTARRLAGLPALLGPASPGLLLAMERKMREARGARPARPRPARRWRLAAAGLALMLLVVLILTPVGQTAVASFLGIFHLGRTEVQISQTGTPTPAGQTAIREQWSLEEARDRLPFALPQPAYLPQGYRFRAVYSYTYPDLPEWVPQPVLVDVDYGNLTLRVYPIMLGEEASISRLNLETTSVQKVQDLEVNGQPGVLLRAGDTWQEIVWEQGDLVLALWAAHLSEEELLAVARSVVEEPVP
jgi:hypothetical protein